MGRRRIYFIYTKTLLFYFVISLLILILTINSKASVSSAKDALVLCYKALIPSLFPFFVLSGILIRTGFVKVLGAVLSPLVRPLFNISGEGAFAFVIGIISGYPMGAKVASELYTTGVICKDEAERLLPFCNNSGPLFIIGAIGAGMLKDTGLGIKLYLIHIASAILVGLVFKRYGKRSRIRNEFSIKSIIGRELRATMEEKKQSLGKILSETVSSAVNTTLLICGFIVLFSVLSECITPLIDVLAQSEQVKLFVSGIFEITAGISRVTECVNMSLNFKMFLISFLTGFGGICVHLQVLGVTSGSGLKMRKYIIGKAMQAVFAATITFVLF